MKKPTGGRTTKKDRRRFLEGMVVAGGAATVAAVSPGAVAATADAEPGADAGGRGYRVTGHIRAYYKTAGM